MGVIWGLFSLCFLIEVVLVGCLALDFCLLDCALCCLTSVCFVVGVMGLC